MNDDEPTPPPDDDESITIRPSLTLADAVQACRTSRTTLRRALDRGAFPNAWREPGPDGSGAGRWRIPITDLIREGFEPNVTRPDREQSGDTAAVTPGHAASPDMAAPDQVSASTHIVKLQSEVDKWRAIAEERAERIEDLRMSMRMLDAGPRQRELFEPEPPAVYTWPVKRPPKAKRWFRPWGAGE